MTTPEDLAAAQQRIEENTLIVRARGEALNVADLLRRNFAGCQPAVESLRPAISDSTLAVLVGAGPSLDEVSEETWRQSRFYPRFFGSAAARAAHRKGELWLGACDVVVCVESTDTTGYMRDVIAARPPQKRARHEVVVDICAFPGLWDLLDPARDSWSVTSRPFFSRLWRDGSCPVFGGFATTTHAAGIIDALMPGAAVVALGLDLSHGHGDSERRVYANGAPWESVVSTPNADGTWQLSKDAGRDHAHASAGLPLRHRKEDLIDVPCICGARAGVPPDYWCQVEWLRKFLAPRELHDLRSHGVSLRGDDPVCLTSTTFPDHHLRAHAPGRLSLERTGRGSWSSMSSAAVVASEVEACRWLLKYPDQMGPRPPVPGLAMLHAAAGRTELVRRGLMPMDFIEAGRAVIKESAQTMLDVFESCRG